MEVKQLFCAVLASILFLSLASLTFASTTITTNTLNTQNSSEITQNTDSSTNNSNSNNNVIITPNPSGEQNTAEIYVVQETNSTPTNNSGPSNLLSPSSPQTQPATSPSSNSIGNDLACSDTKPSTPKLVSAKISAKNQVTLSWTKPEGPVTGYVIFYGLNPNADQYATLLNSDSATSMTINHLSPNTKYYFKIQSLNNCVPSDYSNILVGSKYKASIHPKL